MRARQRLRPFYCPEDQNAYLDLSFFEEMKDRFSAPGEFAEAYVIAHEIGHHVQNELGIFADGARRTRQERRAAVECDLRKDRAAGRLLRRCLGLSCRPHQAYIEQGDVEAALNAASAGGRRSPAAPGTWRSGAGRFHARQLGPQGALVQT
jgi:predicted metalloprotease